MIILEQSSYIGKGSDRYCYLHPDDSGLCIKILCTHPEDGYPERVRRELKYYRHLERRNISWELLSRYMGVVETNLGVGHVYTLIRDEDGRISKDFIHYLSDEELLNHHAHELSVAFHYLYQYLLENRIITGSIYPQNLVFQLGRKPKLVIVDDIGNSEFLPISNFSRTFAQKKIKRRWHRFVLYLHKMYPDSATPNRISISRTTTTQPLKVFR